MIKTALVLLALLIVCVSAHRGGQGRHGFKAFMDRYQRVCAEDQKRVCPDLESPQGPREIGRVFDSECFKAAEATLSNPCQQMVTEWRQFVSALHNGQHPMPQHDGPNKNDDDDDDDNDDGQKDSGKTPGDAPQPSTHHNSVGTPFYQACHQDRVNLCPNMPDHVSPHDFFSAKCAHKGAVSEPCKKYYEEWRATRIAIFGIVMSSTFITMFAGLFTLLAVCCCVACCIRKRKVMRRRCRRASPKLPVVNKKSKIVEATPSTIDSAEAALVVPVEMDQNSFPMQTFPAGAAYHPYAYPPQYWQPVLFAPPTGAYPGEVAKSEQ